MALSREWLNKNKKTLLRWASGETMVAEGKNFPYEVSALDKLTNNTIISIKEETFTIELTKAEHETLAALIASITYNRAQDIISGTGCCYKIPHDGIESPLFTIHNKLNDGK